MWFTAVYLCRDENYELLNASKVIWALDIFIFAFLLHKEVFEIELVNIDSEKSKILAAQQFGEDKHNFSRTRPLYLK